MSNGLRLAECAKKLSLSGRRERTLQDHLLDALLQAMRVVAVDPNAFSPRHADDLGELLKMVGVRARTAELMKEDAR